MAPSDRTLIDRLVADAQPVRRLWPPAARLAAWLALVAAMATAVAAAVGWPFAAHHHPGRLGGEIVAVFAALVTWAILALRAALPDRIPSRRAVALAAALALCPLLFWARAPGPAMFVAKGVPCALMVGGLAVLPALALLWAVRRGAALAPHRAAALGGGAGFLAAYLLWRVVCTVDEPLHLLVWHALPVALGIAVAAGAGGWWLRSSGVGSRL